jgi:hypothetical protein
MGTVEIHPVMLAKIPWMDFPAVLAPHPERPDDEIHLSVSSSTLMRLYRANHRSKIFQAWAHLVGSAPPIPNVSIIRPQITPVGLGVLRNANACFQGLNRPHNTEEFGDSVYAYVVQSVQTLAWHASMVCAARVARNPPETVLVVYAQLTEPLHKGGHTVSGAVIQWEFVPADKAEPRLPNDFAGRYAKELWRR